MFGDLFRNIRSVEITTDLFSLDNVVIGIPERRTSVLLLACAVLVLASRVRKRPPLLWTRRRLCARGTGCQPVNRCQAVPAFA